MKEEDKNNNSALTAIIFYALTQYALIDWKLHDLINWSWWFVLIPSFLIGSLVAWVLVSVVTDSVKSQRELQRKAREEAVKEMRNV
tara:strand:+ start:47 stop:304 length:258 start_codon:yes stop_codon:yes gene_type:complete